MSKLCHLFKNGLPDACLTFTVSWTETRKGVCAGHGGVEVLVEMAEAGGTTGLPKPARTHRLADCIALDGGTRAA